MPAPNELYFFATLNDENVKVSLDDLKNKIRGITPEAAKAGDAMSYSMRNARGSLQLLARDFGITLPRAVQTFLADTKLIGPILAASFGGAAIATLAIPVLTQIINKVEEMSGAAEKNRKAWTDFSLTLTEESNKMADSFTQLSLKTLELEQGKLPALIRQYELLGRASKELGKESQDLLQQFSKLAEESVSYTDRLVQAVSYLAGWNRVAGETPLSDMQTGFREAGKEATQFGEKLRRTLDYRGVQAGLDLVNSELATIYQQMEKTPSAEGWIAYREAVEFEQHKLQMKLDEQEERRKQKLREWGKTLAAEADEEAKRATAAADKQAAEQAKRNQAFINLLKQTGTELGNLGQRWGKVGLSELEQLTLQYEQDRQKALAIAWAPYGPANAKAAIEEVQRIDEGYLRKRGEMIDEQLKKITLTITGSNPVTELYAKYPVRALPPPEYPIPDFSGLDRKLSIVRTSVYGVNEAFTDMFRGIGQGTMNAAEMFQNLAAAAIDAMGRMITQMFIVNVLMRAMSGLFGLGAGTKIGGAGTTVPTTTPPALYGATWPGAPGHDYPGPAMAGRTYRIGTAEYFTPATDGWIQPVRGTGSQAVTVNLVNQSSQPVRGKASQQIDARGLVTTIVLTDFDTNGPIAQALKAGR